MLIVERATGVALSVRTWMELSTTMSSPTTLLSGCATNPFSRALHIKNPSSTKCAASIQSAACLATVLIARVCRLRLADEVHFPASLAIGSGEIIKDNSSPPEPTADEISGNIPRKTARLLPAAR